MKGLLLKIAGNWGHFKKPETNNNPLTHDFITKTALMGLIGAVLGVERREMASLFPEFSEDLLYGVTLCNPVKKEPWGFTVRDISTQESSRQHNELLKSPSFLVAIAWQNERSDQRLTSFGLAVKNDEACFPPVLGLHNCPAELQFVAIGEFEKYQGEFVTKGFITDKHVIDLEVNFRLAVDRMPTYQNNDFWNLPEKYQKVVYPFDGNPISAKGEYYQFMDGSQWVLI
ncbi:MAG: CRISPR-associated protein [bacterium]|nr:MAG: CRISPR-associated protein [bacterium]